MKGKLLKGLEIVVMRYFTGTRNRKRGNTHGLSGLIIIQVIIWIYIQEIWQRLGKKTQSYSSWDKWATKGSEVWSITDYLSHYNMNKTSNELKESIFTTGSILYHSLDMVKGTFEIRNTSKKLVAEVKGLSTKTHLLPFVSIYYTNT